MNRYMNVCECIKESQMTIALFSSPMSHKEIVPNISCDLDSKRFFPCLIKELIYLSICIQRALIYLYKELIYIYITITFKERGGKR